MSEQVFDYANRQGLVDILTSPQYVQKWDGPSTNGIKPASFYSSGNSNSYSNLIKWLVDNYTVESVSDVETLLYRGREEKKLFDIFDEGFNQRNPDWKNTIKKEGKLEDRSVNITFFDLGGQDRYRFMQSSYVRGANMGVLVIASNELIDYMNDPAMPDPDQTLLDFFYTIVINSRGIARFDNLLLVNSKKDLIIKNHTEEDMKKLYAKDSFDRIDPNGLLNRILRVYDADYISQNTEVFVNSLVTELLQISMEKYKDLPMEEQDKIIEETRKTDTILATEDVKYWVRILKSKDADYVSANINGYISDVKNKIIEKDSDVKELVNKKHSCKNLDHDLQLKLDAQLIKVEFKAKEIVEEYITALRNNTGTEKFKLLIPEGPKKPEFIGTCFSSVFYSIDAFPTVNMIKSKLMTGLESRPLGHKVGLMGRGGVGKTTLDRRIDTESCIDEKLCSPVSPEEFNKINGEIDDMKRKMLLTKTTVGVEVTASKIFPTILKENDVYSKEKLFSIAACMLPKAYGMTAPDGFDAEKFYFKKFEIRPEVDFGKKALLINETAILSPPIKK